MTSASLFVLKSWICRNSDAKKTALLGMLCPSLQNKLEALEESAVEKRFELSLDKIHWSWFVPTLQSYSQTEQALFLGALDPTITKKLSSQLQIERKEDLSSFAALFFQNTLFSHVVGLKKELIPPSSLPYSPLNPLLDLSKPALIERINRLSLFGLGQSLKQIVDPKSLKTLESTLNEEEKELIQKTLVEKYPFPKLEWEKWDGSKEAFRVLLHKRGLTLFGIALSKEHPDLIWYLCHLLDIGRGSFLFKQVEQEVSKELIPPLTEQLTQGLS